MLSYALVNMLVSARIIPTEGWWQILIAVSAYIPPFTLAPRFILSLRELHSGGLQGRRGSNIDTAFGLTSAFGHDATALAVISADAGQDEGLGRDEEIRMEERETRGTGSGALEIPRHVLTLK